MLAVAAQQAFALSFHELPAVGHAGGLVGGRAPHVPIRDKQLRGQIRGNNKKTNGSRGRLPLRR